MKQTENRIYHTVDASLLPHWMDQLENIVYSKNYPHSLSHYYNYYYSSVCLLRISALCLAWKQEKKTFDQIYKNLFVNSSKRQSQELDFRRWKHNSKVVYFLTTKNFFFHAIDFFFFPSLYFVRVLTFVLITVLEFVALKRKFLTAYYLYIVWSEKNRTRVFILQIKI